ncbi:MAG TPA: 16S rRNA (cytidine(1402)-2'-O)-methyltransferase [Burkholderiaceae bacterium]|nr:16S rRNA (cytidine(1402)-2'-O)-methyltransferase [Burkholderiaceae bacterium]
MLTEETPALTPEPDEREQRSFTTGAGSLYVVATPIGNLSDIGQRAASVLREVKWVAAEDTRVSRVLLDHLGCRPPLVALHQHNERAAGEALIRRLLAGETGALISDAGTPAISDPGARLVAAAHEAGVRIIPVPGASAPVTLLSAAGLEPAPFVFEGFLPPRPRARDQRLRSLRAHCDALGAHLVLFEAPHRIAKTLQVLADHYGPDRPLAIGRELTKRFEEVVRITTGGAVAWLQSRPTRSRGEFVLAVGAPVAEPVALAAGAAGAAGAAAADAAVAGTSDQYRERPTGDVAMDAADDAAGDETEDGTGPAGSPDRMTSVAGTTALVPALAQALPDSRALLARLLRDLPVSRAVKLARDLTGLPHKELYSLALELKGAAGEDRSDDS